VIASPSGREQPIFGESQPGDAHTEVAAERDLYRLGGSAQIASDVAHKFLRIAIRINVYDDTHMMAMSAIARRPILDQSQNTKSISCDLRNKTAGSQLQKGSAADRI
jgi:hypothetical protein